MLEKIYNYYLSLNLINSFYDQIKLIVILIGFWTYLFAIVQYTFKFQKRSIKIRNDTKNRIISIVHGISTFFLAAYSQLFLENTFEQTNSQFQSFIIIFSLSYIVYDLVACYYYDLFDTGLLIHHSFCILGYCSSIFTAYGIKSALAGLFYSQISNFPMHARMIIKNFGLRYSKLYQLSQNIYLSSYIIARGIFVPIYCLYPTLMSTNTPIGVKIICIGISVQSWHYISQMAGILRKKMKQYKQMKQKNVEYKWFTLSDDLQKLSYVKFDEKQKIF